MPRPPMYTPVEPLPSAVGLTKEERDPDYLAGKLARVDLEVQQLRVVVGQRPHTRVDPQTGEHVIEEGHGMARDLYHVKKTLGRFPGTNGLDDDGEGLALMAFEQRRRDRTINRKTSASIAAAALAVLTTLAHLVSASMAPPRQPPAAAQERR